MFFFRFFIFYLFLFLSGCVESNNLYWYKEKFSQDELDKDSYDCINSCMEIKIVKDQSYEDRNTRAALLQFSENISKTYKSKGFYDNYRDVSNAAVKPLSEYLDKEDKFVKKYVLNRELYIQCMFSKGWKTL